ncbi:hypothetical protein LBMAG53_01840 [Planctomycetota bacterium]|nr:hypothetical protein LBMAG53_01840 [Planctomycetota bacterium]
MASVDVVVQPAIALESGRGAAVASDRALLAAYARWRDMDAFRTLIDRHQADLLRTAHAILGESHAAQDAVQEGFLRLCREAVNLAAQPERSGGNLGGWLAIVIRNHCIDRLRQRRETAPLSRDPETPPDPAPDSESGEILWKAVAELPPLERAAVVLRYRDGLGYDQIAARLGKTANHIGVILHQGLSRLRESQHLRERLGLSGIPAGATP